jgi:hypothetical protein
MQLQYGVSKMSKLKVCGQQCDQCLFGPNKIVSEARKQQILSDCKREDTHFVCHKHDDVVCRSFYNQSSTNLIRIMERLNGIQFID